MTLEEMVAFEEDRAELCDSIIKSIMDSGGDATPFVKCSENTRQVVEWLRELKELREKQEWTPLTMREMSEEEKQHYVDIGYSEIAEEGEIFNCSLPEDGQEVLISIGDYVMEDTFLRDDIFGCYFENADICDVDAWMPKPMPYEEENR